MLVFYKGRLIQRRGSVIARASGWWRTLLLHKVCVSPKYRNQVIDAMLLEVLRRAEDEHCDLLELWAYEAKTIARHQYSRVGLPEQCIVNDYYGKSRNGIKVSVQLPR